MPAAVERLQKPLSKFANAKSGSAFAFAQLSRNGFWFLRRSVSVDLPFPLISFMDFFEIVR